MLVEGESDCWVLWNAGFPALGIPGAKFAKCIKAQYIKGINRIYIFQEPGEGGDTFVRGVVRKLRGCKSWKGQTFVVKAQ